MPQSTGFKLAVMGTAIRRQDFFIPNSSHLGNQSLRGSRVPGLKLEWNMPEQTPKTLGLITTFFLNLIFIRIKLIYNVVFFVGVQHLVQLHIYIYLFIFGFSSHIGY